MSISTGTERNTRIYNNIFHVGKEIDVLGVLYTRGTLADLYFANNIFHVEGKLRHLGRRRKGHGDGTFDTTPGVAKGDRPDGIFDHNA